MAGKSITLSQSNVVRLDSYASHGTGVHVEYGKCVTKYYILRTVYCVGKARLQKSLFFFPWTHILIVGDDEIQGLFSLFRYPLWTPEAEILFYCSYFEVQFTI